jgi:hypothetical protein
MTRSTNAFCHGECGAVRMASMFITAIRVGDVREHRIAIVQEIPGCVVSNALRNCCAVQAAVGWSVTPTSRGVVGHARWWFEYVRNLLRVSPSGI